MNQMLIQNSTGERLTLRTIEQIASTLHRRQGTPGDIDSAAEFVHVFHRDHYENFSDVQRHQFARQFPAIAEWIEMFRVIKRFKAAA